MSINIQSSASAAYVNVNARAIRSQVTLSGNSESVSSALSSSKNGGSGNIAGKLNSLEHAATTNPRPMFLKGVLKELTGVKASGIDIQSFELDRSRLAVDATQSSLQTADGSVAYSSERLRLYSQSMNLEVQGTINTKSGDNLNFDMQIGSSRLSATYAGIAYQSSATNTKAARTATDTLSADLKNKAASG